MRKTLFCWQYILAFIILLSFDACKKHNIEPIDTQELLLGTWQSECISDKLLKDGELIRDIVNADDRLRIIINADGTFVQSEKSMDGNWSDNTGKWYYRDGTVITVYDEEDYQEVCTLKSITATTLEIEMNETWEENQSAYSAYYYARYRRVSQ